MSQAEWNDVAEFDALCAIAREYDLDSLIVEDGDWRMELVRREPQAAMAVAPTPATFAPAAVSVLDAPSSSTEPPPGVQVLAAPIVGVFYCSPAPGAPPFVQIGDRVSIGQTLCILEAMKLMNEITSDYSGVITAIGPENGDLVTIGQTLFQIAANA